jgi:Calx-beta domain/RTX calcium-binding nonapeptide repeat (4 copies)
MPLVDFSSIQPTVLTANADLLAATDLDDAIVALGGADTIFGLGGFDYINGNQGDDLLYGNAADDLILGGQGSDLLFGGQNADSLFGNIGDDFIFGNLGNDTIWAGQDNDIVRAGKEHDWLLGERGRDILYGELGDDTLDGGADADTLEGGEGSDRFILDTLTGSTTLAQTDVIHDFTRTQDTLFVRDGLQYEQLTIAQGTGEYAGDTIVQVRDTNQYLAILKGVTSTDLAIADFAGLSPSPTPPGTGTGGTTPGTGTGGTTPGTGTGGTTPGTGTGGTTPGTGGTPTTSSIEFAAATRSINENAGTATISVKRTGDTSQTSQIQYATSDGTAIAGSDYTAATGTLTFAAGETAKTLTIAIRNDNTAEPSETLQITLTNAVGSLLGTQKQMALTITDDDPIAPPPTPAVSAIDSNSVAKFTPSDTEATIAASGAQKIAIGTQTLYIGTWQKTGINQDPIIASFDSANPSNNWVKTNYEMTGADGRGYGLFWDGSNLYGIFSTDGTQGTASEDWRRVSGGATQSWLRSYGAGGGPKIAVVGKINLATGELLNAAYLSARRIDDGKTNSLAVTGLTVSNGNLQVTANSWWAPRNTDGSSMAQVGTAGSPHAYTLLLSPDLKTAIGAKATGWVSNNTTGLS